MTHTTKKVSDSSNYIIKMEHNKIKQKYRTMLQYYALNAMQIQEVMELYLSREYKWDDEQLIRVIGIKRSFINKLEDSNDSKTVKYKKLKTQIKRLHRKTKAMYKEGQTLLEINIAKLGDVIGLTKIEQQVLIFTIIIKQEGGFYSLLDDHIKNMPKQEFGELLSSILNEDYHELIYALNKKSRLLSSGIVKSEKHVIYDNYELKLIDGMSFHLMEEDFCLDELLSEYVSVVNKFKFSISNFKHMKKDLDLILPYLTETLSKNLKGVNILIHGKPGTGKTELARTIARFLNVTMYSVKSEDIEGEPVSGLIRLEYLKFAQQLLKKGNYLILSFLLF